MHFLMSAILKVGETFVTVKRWENGKGEPSPLTIWQIEKLVGRISGV